MYNNDKKIKALIKIIFIYRNAPYILLRNKILIIIIFNDAVINNNYSLMIFDNNNY